MAREMRYQRGVKLTPEEREGGGEGAGRAGNPNVPAGAYGGAVDYGGAAPGYFSNEFATPFGMTLLGLTQGDRLFAGDGGAAAGEGAGGANTELLRALTDLWRTRLDVERNRPREAFQAEQQALDPVGWAQKQYQARLASDPWAAGGAFEGRRAADLYTPEYLLASQGGTAENQIARMGGRKGIDPEELRRMNALFAGGRRTYT